ncbi:MAG: ferritin family protein [Elusimicrobia bacterium]|nr:ferritin family protein [Elusimicrobiota bacterium]
METIKNDSLEFALDFEIKGTNLYLDLARKTKNILGKQLFYSLAGQEVEHAKRIEEIYDKLKNDKTSETILPQSLPSVESVLKEFFLKAGSTDLKKDTDNIPGYELAMEMERKGYKAYEGFYNNAKNESEKKFFRQLMKEENEHLISLQNVYFYLTKSGDWLQEDESKVWSWMNF